MENVDYLIETIGSKLTALTLGLHNTGDLKNGKAALDLPRIDGLVRIIRAMLERDSVPTVRAYLIGMWPELDDRSPLLVLRDTNDVESTVNEIITIVKTNL